MLPSTTEEHEGNEALQRNPTSANTLQTMAWRIVCELLLLSKFVSLSVIPEHRTLNHLELGSSTGETNSQRTKRSIDSYYSDEDDDDMFTVPEHWESVCPTIQHRWHVAKQKHDGEVIFQLAPREDDRGTLEYYHFVTTWDCENPDTIVSIGGERFKCVQQRVEHEVEVLDVGTNPPKPFFTKTFFINSGCDAKILR